MKFYPPQLEILQGLNLPKNVFSFKVANASNNIIPVRLFGSLADLTRINTNNVSVVTENINVATYSTETIDYNEYIVNDEKLTIYSTDVNNYLAKLLTADGLTSSVGDLEIVSADLKPYINAYPQNFLVSKLFLDQMFEAKQKTLTIPDSITLKSVATNVTVGNTPAMQTGANPFIIDGNFATNLTATSMTTGKKLADLWSYVLSNDLHLKALMIVADNADAPLSNIEVEEINPFFTPDNEILALSKYQNPYVVNKYAGLATDIDILVNKNRYFDINIYPQNTMFHLFFE